MVLFDFNTRKIQQVKQVVQAEGKTVNPYIVHYLPYQLHHFHLMLTTVTSDDSQQSRSFRQLWRKPHAAFLPGGQLPVLEEIEESRYFRCQFLQKVCIVTFKAMNFPYPVTCLARVNDDGQAFVIGTKHELGEESNLVTVLAFGFHLVGKCGT